MFGFNRDFGIGVLKAVAYYTVGSAFVWVTYLVFGWEYMHAPGLHHLVGLLVLVIGAILLIRRLIEMFTNSGNSRNKGALLIHAIAVIVFILFFKLIILNGAIKRDTGEPLTSGKLTVDTSFQL
jgi:membrane-bound ClpP family serine protease